MYIYEIVKRDTHSLHLSNELFISKKIRRYAIVYNFLSRHCAIQKRKKWEEESKESHCRYLISI